MVLAGRFAAAAAAVLAAGGFVVFAGRFALTGAMVAAAAPVLVGHGAEKKSANVTSNGSKVNHILAKLLH